MRRVAIIGNSHIAALKLGWDQIREEFPEAEITFFGAQAEGLLQSKVVAGFLVPQLEWVRESLRFTSNGQEAVCLRDYDAILVVGCRFGIFPIIDLYLAYRSEDHRNLEGATHLMSEALFRRMAHDALDATLALRLYRSVRPACAAPMWLVPQAMVSEGILAAPDDLPPAAIWKALEAAGDDAPLLAVYQACLEAFRAEGIQFLEQPVQTLARPLFTRHPFTVGSVRLTESFAEQHDASDFWHMNASFGAATLRDFLPETGNATASRPAAIAASGA